MPSSNDPINHAQINLNRLFTIQIHFAADLTIISTSKVLREHAPDVLPGHLLTDAFEFARPRSMTSTTLTGKLDMLFLLVAKQSRYPIRGQVVPLEGPDGGYMLLGAPWLSRIDADDNLGFTISDFPPHDAQLDWLFMLGTERKQVEDLTRLSDELTLAKETAEAATESKANFLAVMTHEMRTPLNGVIAVMGLLDEQQLSSSQRNLVELGSSAAENLLSVVNDVLDLSKIDAGQLSLEPAQFSMRLLVHDVEEIQGARAMARGLRLSSHVDPGVPDALVADHAKIRQVLLNYLSNAIKFTNEGSIDVRVQLEPAAGGQPMLQITVEDTGTGVAEEHKSSVFQEFWSRDSSDNNDKGTGLGLGICKRLAELMQGSVGFSSALGVGSTFWLKVPVDVAAEPAKANIASNFGNSENQELIDLNILNALINDVGSNHADTVLAQITDELRQRSSELTEAAQRRNNGELTTAASSLLTLTRTLGATSTANQLQSVLQSAGAGGDEAMDLAKRLRLQLEQIADQIAALR